MSPASPLAGAHLSLGETSIAGVLVVDRALLEDERGHLARLFCATELSAALAGRAVAQVNLTRTSTAGTVRGAHFQRAPYAETKIVTCVRGSVFDVAIDLRRGSPTYLSWHAEILSETNRRSLVVPEGCAHALQSLTDGCEMLYVHTAPYVAGSEDGADALDPRLGIAWPRPVTLRSPRDEAFAPLDDSFTGLSVGTFS